MSGSYKLWFAALIALWIFPTPIRAEKKPNPKKICKQAREELKAIEKELQEIKEKRSQILQQIDQVKMDFKREQEKLQGMSHCSHGNPHNPPGCEAQLSKVRELGDQITQLQESLNPLTPRRVQLENAVVKPKNDLILNKCEGK